MCLYYIIGGPKSSIILLQIIQIFKSLVLAANVPKVPTFSWQEEPEPPTSLPLLRIDYPDGIHHDFAVLKRFNPFPKTDRELEEDIDNCIFNGHLLYEKDVYVALTGGCPYDDHFEVFHFNKTSLFETNFMKCTFYCIIGMGVPRNFSRGGEIFFF